MSDKAKFSHSDFPNDKKLSIGINAKKNSNLQEWLEVLYLLAKKHFGIYAQAIKDRKIPKEWTDRYVPTEIERKAAAEDEFTKIELTEKVKARANRLEGWINCKPSMVEYIVNALTEGSISIIKDKYRRDWMTSIETDDIIVMLLIVEKSHTLSGKATGFADKSNAEQRFRNLKLQSGESLSAFNKRIHDAEIELQRLDVEIASKTKCYLFLLQMYNYHDPVIRQKVSEYLATSNDDDKFPTSREDLVEEFMRIESVKNIVGDNNSKDTGNMTNNVTKSNGSKDAPEILTFEDGTHGIKMKDGSYQVFVVDKKGVPTNVKHMKGYETKKKGIGLKPFKEKETGKEAVSKKEKILVKLMNKHDCSREEAKSKYVKCFKCNDYVNHWTDECTKSNDTTKSKDKLKDKTKKIKFANAYSSISLPPDDDSDASSTASNYYSKHAYVVWSKPLHGEVPYIAAFMTESERKLTGNHYKWIFDPGANINVICNDELVINIRTIEKQSANGIGGPATFTEVGDHPLFGECFINREQTVNLLSAYQARMNGFMSRISNDNLKITLFNKDKNLVLVFHEDANDHLYKCHANNISKMVKKLYKQELLKVYSEGSVYNIAQFYTMEQQARAQEAIRLHYAMDHPSDKSLSAALVSPSVINATITPLDLSNARVMYGPCPDCLEGKPSRHKGMHHSWDPGGKATNPGQLLHVDIVFIVGKPRLFSVDDITGYIVMARMESKGQADVNKAIDAIVSRYQSSLKVVSVISCDAEAVLKSQATINHLASKGIKLAPRIPYEHEKIAERSMRILREKMNAKLSELPYTLPKALYDRLAFSIINNHNNLPNSKTTPRTPAEIITGEKFNFFADLQAPFGSVVLVNHSRSDNKANEIGICLGASHGTKGGIWVFVPNVDKEPKVRRRIQGMPMTQEFINFMNTWSKDKPLKEGEELFAFKESRALSDLGTTDESLLKHEFNIPEPNYHDPTDHLSAPTYSDSTVGDNPVSSHTTHSASDALTPGRIIPTHGEHQQQQQRIAAADPIVNDNDVPGLKNNDDDDIIEQRNNSKPTSVKSILKSPSRTLKPNQEQSPSRMSARIRDPNYKSSYVKPKDAGVHYIEQLNQFLSKTENNDKLNYSAAYASESMTWFEAIKGEHVKEAEAAGLKEIKGLIDIKSWKYLKSIADRTESVHSKVTSPNMLFKPKYDAKGAFLLWKARLVSGGHRTDPRVYDPYEKSSPTIPLEVAKMQLGIASYHDAEVEVFDIPVAYLNAYLKPDKRQVMRIPVYIAKMIVQVDPTARQFVQSDGTLLVEVLRALYGFPESAKLWNEHLTSTLVKGGYTQCPVEPCLFRKSVSTTEWSIVTVYVDDCMHIYRGPKIRDKLYAALKDGDLPTPVIQQLSKGHDISYLGMNISKQHRTIVLSQPGYIKDIIEKYRPDKQYTTPHDDKLFNRPESEKSSNPVDITTYLSILMKLMFLATRTRPDTLTTVCALSTKCRDPNEADMKRLYRVIGYLDNTINLGLTCHVTDLSLHAYMDASWACHADLKGHSGIMITIGHYGFPILCKSTKQKVVTRSSTEAELVCLFSGMDILLYVRRIGQFLDITSKVALPVYQDNTSTITMAYMGKGSAQSNSKFMDLKYFWIKEQLDKGLLRLVYLDTDSMPADFFASPRTGSSFRHFRSIIMGEGT